MGMSQLTHVIPTMSTIPASKATRLLRLCLNCHWSQTLPKPPSTRRQVQYPYSRMMSLTTLADVPIEVLLGGSHGRLVEDDRSSSSALSPPKNSSRSGARSTEQTTKLTWWADPDGLSVGQVRTRGEHGQPHLRQRDVRVWARRTARGSCARAARRHAPGHLAEGENSEFPRLLRKERKQISVERKTG
ncbi:hypothetical protein LZ32DRAFT_364806 [Colletotrichum eremochloae]|nr:hypothetical protein LZ32DRAFT_364806 [Colletotrichum eremochloae]